MSGFLIGNSLGARHSIMRVLERARETRDLMLKVSDLSEADREYIYEVAEAHEEWMRRLRRASISGDNGKCRALIGLALNSKQMKAFAYVMAHRKLPLKDLKASKLSKDVLDKMGQRLNPFGKQKGMIVLEVTPKPCGGKRTVQSFPKHVLALQALVADILIATGHRNPYDFNERWRGPDTAARRIGDEIANGLRYWLSADVSNFYPSIRPAKLPDLNLPWQVLRWVICANRYLPMKGGTEEEKKMARQGLPQGSPASNVIASDLIGRVFQGLPETEIYMGSFTDDLVFGARDRTTIEQVEAQLTLMMAEHPAGPFFFKDCCRVRTSQRGGPTHVGYHFCNGYLRLAGKCRIMPSHKSWETLFAKIYWHLESHEPKNWDEVLARCTEKGEEWRKSKAAWPRNKGADENFEHTIYQLASDYKPGVPFKHHPTLGYKLSEALYKTPS
ncbi:reverse transcriptase domain-containing protein [Parerythrobacter aurantius]|uniref:reverse transcriptase domain-containing protein n=1 Tax=Parerythrobacter aurantius TaxID=3127706 RepID=UPI00324EFA07